MPRDTMNYSAFISHDPADHEKAKQVRQTLEKRGLRCWIKSSDSADDAEQTKRVEQAINASRCLVLLLSQSANQSPRIRREVELAVSKGKPVFPLRLEEVLPSPGLELYVSSTHWIDAWSGQLVDHLDKLCGELAAGRFNTMTNPQHNSPAANPSQSGTVPPERKGKTGCLLGSLALFLILGVVVIAGVGVGAYCYYSGFSSQQAAIDEPLPVVDAALTTEQLMEKLLAAIDAEDYVALRAFAEALFTNRRDLEIADYRGRLQPPVIAAAREGNVELFRALIIAHPVLGLEDQRGREPIHVAAAEGHTAIIELLVVEAKIDPDKPSEGTGFTPLHWAASSGRVASVAKLLELGASPNAPAGKGQTPLHIAVEHKQITAIKALLSGQGTHADAIDSSGQTPLHKAARGGSELIVDLLLGAGASTRIIDADGNTPGQIAHTAGHDDLAEVLGYTTQ